MSRSLKVFAVACLVALGATHAAGSDFAGIGRTATAKEVAAWDIDVRPDFKGLPAGSGSVSKGQDVWEGKCASCHGVFGESNSVFSPLVGGTTAKDIKSGNVAALKDTAYPGRTTLMKVPTLSTLWDYINRAMPWTEPKSLSVEEVYAVTAFLLNLGGIVPDDFTLSDKNMAATQKLMPNRNGMTSAHALWPGNEHRGVAKPDVVGVACMSNCNTSAVIASSLPDFARNAHGNLAQQNRPVGAQIGADTSQPEQPRTSPLGKGATSQATGLMVASASTKSPATPASGKPESAVDGKAAVALTQKHACTACHAVDKRLIGPSFQEIAKKHAGKEDYLAGKIKAGSAGVWGPIPMPAQSLNETDAKTIAKWLSTGAGQ